MKSLCSRVTYKGHDNQSGAYTVFVALLALGLFTVFAFAIDLGHIFLAELRLQRATDAAVARTLQLLDQHSVNDISTTRSFRRVQAHADADTEFVPIKAVVEAEQLAMDNLNLYLGQLNLETPSFDPANPPVQVIVDEASTPLTVRASGSLQIKPFFINLFPGFNDSVNLVSKVAVGEHSKIIVALILDRSGSMNWDSRPLTDGDCIPWVTDQPEDCTPVPTRYDAMLSAATDFVGRVYPKAAATIVTEFSTSTSTTLLTDPSQFNISSPAGETNIAEALRSTKTFIDDLIANHSDMDSYHKVAILLTDGGPTLGADLAANNPNCSDVVVADDLTPAEHFISAIRAADAMSDYTFFTIGFGPQPEPDVSASDPYQGGYSYLVKTNLLTRIANDRQTADEEDFADFPVCVPQRDQLGFRKRGKAFFTESDIATVFEMVRKQIGSRLTN